jgi:hypothetical protein
MAVRSRRAKCPVEHHGKPDPSPAELQPNILDRRIDVAGIEDVDASRARLREPSIGILAGNLERLHRPIRYGPCRLCSSLLVRNPGDDRVGDLTRIGAESLYKFHVPEMMKVAGLEPLCDDPLPISARVMIVGRMKGLMEVADQVQDELQRDNPFLEISSGIGEFCRELLDLIDDAFLGWAIRGNRAGR